MVEKKPLTPTRANTAAFYILGHAGVLHPIAGGFHPSRQFAGPQLALFSLWRGYGE